MPSLNSLLGSSLGSSFVISIHLFSYHGLASLDTGSLTPPFPPPVQGDTLKEVFDKAGLDADHLTIDAFNVLADYSVYQRFDNFNSKYSPFKLAQMRRIFLKVDNHIEGRYFAELTKRVFARHEQDKGHRALTEMRLSVYGMEVRNMKGTFTSATKLF